MKVLVVGASGATGRLLVEQLLDRGNQVKVIVRSPDKLPEAVKNHANLEIVKASVLDLGDTGMIEQVQGCDAVASCLGHVPNFKGMYGPPLRLVTDSVRRLCDAVKAAHPEKQVRFVLMNTTGNRNRNLNETIPVGHKIVDGLLRLLLPPHVDNIKAAEYLRSSIGQEDEKIAWVAVRPDGLIDESEVSDYDLHPSPVRNPIFDPGKTSRINVAHFMADLITVDAVWERWKGQMPVIYNRD